MRSAVNSQSKRETYFPTISPTPEAVSADGAVSYTFASAKSAAGGVDGKVIFAPFKGHAATFDTNPSTLGAVGKDTKGIFSEWHAYLVMSCTEPEPHATRH